MLYKNQLKGESGDGRNHIRKDTSEPEKETGSNTGAVSSIFGSQPAGSFQMGERELPGRRFAAAVLILLAGAEMILNPPGSYALSIGGNDRAWFEREQLNFLKKDAGQQGENNGKKK